MRIGTRGYIDLIKSSVARPAQRLSDLYSQLTSGKRVTKLSDDPLVASRSVRGQAALQEIDARKFVIQAAQPLLGAADGALGEMAPALARCHDLALRAVSPELDPSERQAMAQEIRQISSSLVAAGNQAVHGQYVFAGSKIDVIPFQETPGGNLPVTYSGNHQQLAYTISPSQTAPVGLTGAYIFNFPDASGQRPLATVDTDVFSLLKDLADSVERGDVNRVGDLGQEVQTCQAHVVAARGKIGAMTQSYDQALNSAEDAEVRIRQVLSADSDLDYAGAIVDLRQQETVYQAVLGATSRMLNMSDLFDLR